MYSSTFLNSYQDLRLLNDYGPILKPISYKIQLIDALYYAMKS
jgi:hypothetical protein